MHDLTRLLPRHFKILDLALAGLAVKDIAQEVGVEPQTVSNVINSPIFQGELARRRQGLNAEVNSQLGSSISEARNLIEQKAKDAVGVHVELMQDSFDPAVRQRSASQILDLAFGKDAKAIAGVKIDNCQINLLLQAVEESRDV
jgi:N-acetyl-gamma-glutamylphosphate reductase